MAQQTSGTNGGGRKRTPKNSYTTKSGNNIKLHRSLSEKTKVKRDLRAQRKATYLSMLPKGRVQRILYRLHPKRVAAYWFSREGGIMALKLFGVGLVAMFLLVIGVFAYFRKDLPAIKDLSGDKLGGSITYYDKTGQTVLWQDYDQAKRVPVTDENINNYMKQATVAIEDKNFYNHGAVDFQGIARAAVNDLKGSSSRQGGSTITQQLVKNSEQWTNDSTYGRKIKEIILAVELEREYSKKEILTGYLNIAPYGGVNYGVESASRDYFGKSAKDLTLAEASMLSGIPKAPSSLSPYSDPRWNSAIAESGFNEEALIARQRYILDQMVDQGMVTKAQADAAKKVDILATVKPMSDSKYDGIKAPYFVLAAKDQLRKKYGDTLVNRGGWKVTTTLDMNLQNKAEELVQKNQANIERYKADTQAIVAQDVKTGQMVALVGGSDFNNPEYGKLNFANSVYVSPGSSFKPYDYASLIENTTNTGAGSVLYDVQQPLTGYPCTNKTPQRFDDKGNCLYDFDLKYPGALTLRYAIGGSRNVPAVKAMLAVGTDKVIKTANSMMDEENAYKCFKKDVDINNASASDQEPCYGSSAIGDGAYLHLDDHVNGLGTFARLGNALPKTYILKITDASNKNVYTWTQPAGKQVMRAESAYILNDMLSDPKASYLSGSGKYQNWNGWKIAVKTGTSNDNYDNLMTTWNTQYAVATWVGYHTRLQAVTGSSDTVTMPLARGFMQYALADKKPENWTAPTGIKTLPAYVVRTHVGYGSVEPSPTNDLYPSWYQPKTSASGTQTIDRVSGKLATSCTPESAKLTAGGANDNSFSSDPFWPLNKASANSNGTATGSDDTHNCNDTKPSVTITAPDNCDANTGGCTFTATVTQGTHPLSADRYPGTVNFMVNGQTVNSQQVSNSPSTVTYNYKPTSSGQATVTAQIIDSVLYDSTSSATVNLRSSPTAGSTPGGSPTTSGNP